MSGLRRVLAAGVLVAGMTTSAAMVWAGQNRAWPSEGAPRPLAARGFTFPEYEIRTLPNGLQVVAVLQHEQPVVTMRMIVRAGAAEDPPGKAGLANLVAALLTQGTPTKSARQVADEIDFMGGSMGTGAAVDLSYANVLVMKDGFDEGLRMLSDTLRMPAFAPEEIARQRQQILSTLQVNVESPEWVADAVFDRLVYGVHPYGLPQHGTPASIASLSREDLVAFHERFYAPNNAILAVVGDLTAEEAFSGVEKVFGAWARREQAALSLAAPPEPARRVVVVNKPNAVQTEVRVGHLGIRRNHQDYTALNMALRILGGDGANRLHGVLRTQRGLTYGVKADLNTLLTAGDFEASTSTRSEATAEVLRLMVDEIWRLKRERVAESELTGAESYVTGSYPLTIETPDAIATQVLNMLFYGLPAEQVRNFRERVTNVRVDDVERVSRYYLAPDRLSVVLVGNAAAFLPQLRKIGFPNVEVVDMADLDLMAADLRRPGALPSACCAPGGRPAPGGGRRPGQGARTDSSPDGATLAYVPAYAQATASRQAEDVSPARALLMRIVAAKGGEARLRSARSLVVTARAKAVGPDARADTADTTTFIEYPDHVRVESTIRGTSVLQVFDGRRAWLRDPNGVHDVPDELLRDFQNGLHRDTLALLVSAMDGTLRIRRLPDSRDEQGNLRQALEFSAADVDPLVMYVDTDGRVVKQAYAANGMGSPLVEELFSDFRTVDGLLVNFAATVRVGGQPALERTVGSVRVGGPLDPALFTRPAP